MSEPISFESYLDSLGPLSAHIDPTIDTPESAAIKDATVSLAELPAIDTDSLSTWIKSNPRAVPVLGLIVGLSQERLKNTLRDRFDTQGWVKLGRNEPDTLIQWFDEEFSLVELTRRQLTATYDLGDILVARAGSRVVATRATRAGRGVEDDIEAIAKDLGLTYETRTRFEGRNGQTAPCDLVVPNADDAQIVVAAKGFDSTGSKLTDAVREIEEMAAVRKPRQFVLAVIDGIGWKSRKSDLRKIHGLWTTDQIDGMYTLRTLDQFRTDLREAAELRALL
ncbi:MAG: DpnII family type II restriction endonuclease [Brevibacterium aurantiacum]|uniref:DpnII family type II restriction endonuclease n=1 Tax=Brevibacterium aurantiacum TaxID=273384 RepID=UPI003F902CE7